ncbi:hypothetical protein DFH07DRAFT_767102 [Mycena maculata]|uniref:Uncharacterized protein n=1 Tax=Mycena maculata TaxID=230809 RepID=A0AAD7NUK9_9AGAR|nr:hypothetical protein DFH07DRAFT_767102 [Mycena maculata]
MAHGWMCHKEYPPEDAETQPPRHQKKSNFFFLNSAKESRFLEHYRGKLLYGARLIGRPRDGYPLMCYLQVFWWLLLYDSRPDYAYLGHPELSEEVQRGGGPDSGTELVKDGPRLGQGSEAGGGVGQKRHIRTIGVDHYIPRAGRFEAKQNGSPFLV